MTVAIIFINTNRTISTIKSNFEYGIIVIFPVWKKYLSIDT